MIRSESESHLWGQAVPHDYGSYLRLTILIRIEQLARECSDIDDIKGELMALAAARGTSFEHIAGAYLVCGECGKLCPTPEPARKLRNLECSFLCTAPTSE